jgi:uncharacterized repeat protein (TIGR03806 family)
VKRVLPLLILAACGGGGGDDDDGAPLDPCVVDGVVDRDGPMCEKLSTYGLFVDANAQEPADGVVPYTLNTPLFSDYAIKFRFLSLPEGEHATWAEPGALDLPVGTILVKTFGYLADRREPDGARDLIETRLLIHKSSGWEGAAYLYDEADEEAELAIAGDTVAAEWLDLDGSSVSNNYEVPNKNQCKNCHEEEVDTLLPIGPKARHLNRDGQLEGLVDAGLLVDAPDPGTWPRAAVFDDSSTGTLEERARTWLDINCAHCHNPTGAARTSGLDLRVSQTDAFEYGICKPPVAAGSGSGGRPFAIVPGDPDQSILVHRIESTEADVKMPELGRNLVHAEGVALIREWIASLTGECPPPTQ